VEELEGELVAGLSTERVTGLFRPGWTGFLTLPARDFSIIEEVYASRQERRRPVRRDPRTGVIGSAGTRERIERNQQGEENGRGEGGRGVRRRTLEGRVIPFSVWFA
jgi:hypothetical protein